MIRLCPVCEGEIPLVNKTGKKTYPSQYKRKKTCGAPDCISAYQSNTFGDPDYYKDVIAKLTPKQVLQKDVVTINGSIYKRSRGRIFRLGCFGDWFLSTIDPSLFEQASEIGTLEVNNG